MRFTRYTPIAALVGLMLLSPRPVPAAANKDMEELQRDVADLEQKVDDLKKGLLDPKTGSISALQMSVQQSQETANKTNSTLNGLNSGIMSTVQSAMKSLNDQLNSVVGLGTTVNNISSDLSNVESSMKDMQSQLNKQNQMLNDLANQVKLLQAPPAPPPGSDASAAPGVATAAPQQPSAQMLFTNAAHDQDSGKGDLAISEFKQFLSLYPNDPNAILAQYNIGNIYYGQGHLEDAVTAFDAALEEYPEDKQTTPNALYMKGMALEKQKKKTEAIAIFRDVVRKYPHSDQAPEATAQLHSLGATTIAGPTKKSPAR